MQPLPTLRLKKNEDRRLRAGHLWIYSNEIDTKATPLKAFIPGQEVRVEAHDKTPLGIAYINPHSLITARIFSRKLSLRLDLDFLFDKLTTALALRTRLFSKPYYRLVFGEGDGLPGLIVDRFGNHLAVQINTLGMDTKTQSVLDALQTVLPETQSILLRNDSPTRLQEGLKNFIQPGFGVPPQQVLVEENNALFHAPLWEGQKTGWFYDHRMNRARMQNYVTGQRVLDVFSYLGGWGIQAARFGAKEVVCVDASSIATQAIIENAQLNQLRDQVQVMCEDAFDALKSLQQAKQRFDVIILDPPAFAKKQKDIKEGLLAYQRINELALKLLETDGILVSCSCSMHISYDNLLQAIRRASLNAHCEVQVLERGHQGPDHPIHIAIPETDYLKMVIARKRV